MEDFPILKDENYTEKNASNDKILSISTLEMNFNKGKSVELFKTGFELEEGEYACISYESKGINHMIKIDQGIFTVPNDFDGDVNETPDLELMFEVYYSAFQERTLENLDTEFEKALEYLVMNYDSEFGYIQIINILNMQIANEKSGVAPFLINSKKLCDMLEVRINENQEILKRKKSKFSKNISAYKNSVCNLEKLKSSCLKK